MNVIFIFDVTYIFNFSCFILFSLHYFSVFADYLFSYFILFVPPAFDLISYNIPLQSSNQDHLTFSFSHLKITK